MNINPYPRHQEKGKVLLDKTKTIMITVSSSAFIRSKKKLPKGKYKNVYSYKMSDGSIKHQSYISKYRWSKYHETERQAAIAVDKYLILKGKDPINILARK